MSMTFNKEQEAAIYSKEPLIVVAAGAGSGKTRVLTERVMHLCEVAYAEPAASHGTQVDAITAITFTEKAAREMKQRIRLSLEEKVNSAHLDEEKAYWLKQKEALDRAVITTFHSFCQRLLNQNAYQAGLPATFQIIDEVDASLLKQEVLQSIFSSTDSFRIAEPFFEHLSKNQLGEYIIQVHDQMRELIPGEEAINQLKIEDLWHSQLSAKEQSWQSQLRAFHQAAEGAISKFPTTGLSKANAAHVQRLTEFFSHQSVDEQYAQALKEVMPARVNSAWKESVPSLYELFEHHWKPIKETLNMNEKQADQSQTYTFLNHFLQLLQVFAVQYHKRKMFQGVLDFADLQQKALTLLQNETIQKQCRDEFKHFMIDEFQDTNALQLEVLQRICPAYQFIVGDTKQSIYQFRGADVSIMNDLEQEALASEQRIVMNKNYRTIQPVVLAVNTIFSQVMAQSQQHSYQTLYQPLEAFREANSGSKEAVEILCGDQDEYERLTNRMLEMVRSKEKIVEKDSEWCEPTWRDMAVLIPTRTHLRRLEKALQQKQIPYEVHSGIGFYQRQEVTDFLTLLRWIHSPFEDFYVLALLRSPLFGLTINDFLVLKSLCEENQTIAEYVFLDDEVLHHTKLQSHVVAAINKLREWMERWVPFQPHPSVHELCYDILQYSGLKTALLLQSNGLQCLKNVEKLIDIVAEEFQTSLTQLLTDIQERIKWSEKQGDASIERAEGNTVTIMTVHGSKGLEFPIVFLPQLNQRPQKETGRFRFHSTFGIVMNVEGEGQTWASPGYQLAKDEADDKAVEEAKRLFYVAATRARDRLILVQVEGDVAANSWLHMIERAKDINVEWFKETISAYQEPWLNQETSVYRPPSLSVNKEQRRIPLSVSEITAYANQPEQYVEQYIRKRTDSIYSKNYSEAPTHELDSSLLGTLVHRGVELVDHLWSEEQAVALALEEHPKTRFAYITYQREVRSLLAAYTRLSLGEKFVNEWQFTLQIEGAEVTGIVDKVVIQDGSLCILDIKTNVLSQSKQHLVDMYKAQLILYKWAFEQVYGRTVDKLFLVALRDEQALYEVTPTQADEEELKETIRKLVNLKTTTLSIEM